MFPYIMIVSALIFFDSGLHKRILEYISKWFRITKSFFDNGADYSFPKTWIRKASMSVVVVFFMIQLLVPFRYVLYPGELFWTEEGYRFSWRVMLMEKAGYANFKVVDPETDHRFYVDNTEFLTRFQEKQMSAQPDFILEYAHFLEDHYQKQGIQDPEIYVESFVALNGRLSQPYVDPKVDLTEIEPSLKHRTWLLPFNDEIKGL
ncbi:MAG: HTTM domain-containing protein [Gracilimonas sp.]|nr:HTTM domain-containing protein [Gracilimonas sp.]